MTMDKTKMIFFRMTGDEEKILIRLYERLGMNRAEYLRHLVRQDADRAGLIVGLADAFGKLPVRGKTK
jgi:hypothetical protein